MAIKKKDGSTYRLTYPNPIMSNQSLWSDEPVAVLNFDYEGFVTCSKFDEPIESEHSYKIIISEKTPELPKTSPHVPLDKIPVEEVEVPVKEIDPSKLPLPKKKKKPKESNIPTELAYCLPAYVDKHYDSFYQEDRSIMRFGKKFSMEVIRVKQSDMKIQLWSNRNNMTQGTVIYLPQDRRWWKITEIDKHGKGETLTCTPSSLQPSFEED